MTYDEFIQNIIDTRGQWGIPDNEYYEKHHIVPRCLGGKGDYNSTNLFANNSHHENCIWLYPREHFIAHKLLAFENPNNSSLAYAYWNMCTLKCQNNLKITAEEYEEARIFLHNNVDGYWKNCNPENHPMYGKDRSGKNNPFYGKTFSDEALQKIADHFKQWKETHPEEFSKNQSRPNAVNGMAIAIKCVETDQYFGCIKEAYEWLRSQGIICPKKHKCLKQFLDTDIEAYGYHWISVKKIPVPRKQKSKDHGWFRQNK